MAEQVSGGGREDINRLWEEKMEERAGKDKKF